MKFLTICFLFAFTANANTVEERIQALEEKVSTLTQHLENTRGFKVQGNNLILQHGATSIMLTRGGSLYLYAEKELRVNTMDSVRIHTGEVAMETAAEMGANAFTMGGSGIALRSKEDINIQSATKKIILKNKGAEFKIFDDGQTKFNTQGKFYVVAKDGQFQFNDIVTWGVRKFSLTAQTEIDMKSSAKTSIHGGGTLKLNGAVLKLNNGTKPAARAGTPVVITAPGGGVVAPSPSTVLLP